ncbi:TMEM175 family protein [Utexia brackfieldae]|uniref:TMEM175 family protein n=1 Tax=Utexia brackfieldae TaxID=3074108 RepID=UPI00370D87A4
MFGKSRIEAFSDGVIAIDITIMVLDLKASRQANMTAMLDLLPHFTSYILSFIYVGLYWHNHHNLFSIVKKVNNKILWANTHLLFWLSLIPFGTSWVGETSFALLSTSVYGFILFMSAIAYFVLQRLIFSHQSSALQLQTALGRDLKGKMTLLLYLCGIIIGIFDSYISFSFYIVIALLLFIPDRRFEDMAEEIAEK